MSLLVYQSSSHCGHSTDVQIDLLFNGDSMALAQLGPGFVLLDAPRDQPPCDATLVLRVDQSERSWTVRLPNGISSQSKRVVISSKG